MASLVLDEPLGVAELQQVSDVAVPQAVQVQLSRQPGCGAGPGERHVSAPQPDPRPPLG